MATKRAPDGSAGSYRAADRGCRGAARGANRDTLLPARYRAEPESAWRLAGHGVSRQKL